MQISIKESSHEDGFPLGNEWQDGQRSDLRSKREKKLYFLILTT